MRIVYYLAASLDGRIAGPDHDLSFLQTLEGGPESGDYLAFYAGVDSLVMGAGTWEFMVRHGSWPYARKPTWLVTRTREPEEFPAAASGSRRSRAISPTSCG